jgi:hypothetical protein
MLGHAVGPYGTSNTIRAGHLRAPALRMGRAQTFQHGGRVDDGYTPIITAGGEYVVDPEPIGETSARRAKARSSAGTHIPARGTAMKYLAAAAALLALTPAHADPAVPYAEWVKHLFPPPQYDVPYPGRVIENRAIDMEDMAGLCAPHPQAGRLLGCSIRFKDSLTGAPRVCFIYIAPDWYLPGPAWSPRKSADMKSAIATAGRRATPPATIPPCVVVSWTA